MVGAGTFPLVAAAVTAALLLTSCLGRPSTAVQGVTTDTITIGGFGPLTGPLSIIGLGARDGMKLAVDEINANGGIRGRRINLIFENAEGPADSIAAARKLAEQDRVYAFVLGSGSVGAAAAADYLREAKLPVYNMVALTPQIHEPFTKTIFQGVVPSAAVLSRNLVAEVADRTTPRPSKVGILAGTFENPEAQLKELGPMFRDKGIETIVQRFDLGDKDFTSQLVALSRANVDVILYLGSFTEAALAIKQAPEKGLQGIPWVLDGAAVSTAIPT